MSGRVLTEVMRSGPEPGAVEVSTTQADASVVIDGVRYRVVLQRSTVAGHVYVDQASVQRSSGR